MLYIIFPMRENLFKAQRYDVKSTYAPVNEFKS